MDKLREAVFLLVCDQHNDRVEALAAKVRNTAANDAAGLNGFFSKASSNKVLENMLSNWQRLDIAGAELAGMLLGAAYAQLAEKNREVVQLVWTGPDLNLLPIRRSEQLLLEIIDSAVESLFIVSFVLIKIPSIEIAIRNAVNRGVDVRMLLETEDKDGPFAQNTAIDRLYAEIPGLGLYIWPREKRDGTQGGFPRVHAKCVVADGTTAFVTSANLTSTALTKNIEMGVQVKGGSIPMTLYEQLIGMIRAKEIWPFAANKTDASQQDTTVKLASLSTSLPGGTEIFVRFKNETLDIEELRAFKTLGDGESQPKANSVVIIRHNNTWLVGKYTWSKLQDTALNQVFFHVVVRGFGPTQQFDLSEEAWLNFRPYAIEIAKGGT
ncbi:MAG: DISARM system phospholipase D-like protein DrmC [Porticoccaceae bacterium]|nr:DISARM system phospholipase D-like protein DrmC [Porticoccaceae bacterium]